jgi:hypothetical protein
MDAMVIDAIDHIALCIADSINDLPVNEREKQRNELVKSFADGLLSKAKAAENRHQQTAKDSLNVYIAYIKPTREERKSASTLQEKTTVNPDTVIDDPIKRFMEMRANAEEHVKV